ncbi:MAG TPA: hypothetical protein VHB73_02720, partial [Alphaproteobacteria bacterium]|nr:hypothetical protein [Alphaproteobacteria bacterium]
MLNEAPHSHSASPSALSWLGRAMTRMGSFLSRKREETAIIEAVEEIIEQPEDSQSAPAPEKQLLTNLLATRGRTVTDIMIPRADIFAVEENTDLRKLAALMAHSGHSRAPVYRRTL